ncbi:MAG: hypothetical protein JRJ29_01005 [Deltaproteobacteria bacterium]|nr:hypothetical protein [Deltaproteobacteria bacterium]
MATSPSAISLVIQEEYFTGACLALSRTLDFSSPFPPLEWSAAREGKERLYKEVVASYQEKHPKIYGLEIQEGLDLCFMEVNQGRLRLMARSFQNLADSGVTLSFISSFPWLEMGGQRTVLCLPAVLREKAPPLLLDAIGTAAFGGIKDACLFTMSGPHFGDRYGLVTKLFKAFREHEVDLPALNCTVASMTGIVAENQMGQAIRAIRSHFHVPEIFRKKHQDR